jgi:hypothetical protein
MRITLAKLDNLIFCNFSNFIKSFQSIFFFVLFFNTFLTQFIYILVPPPHPSRPINAYYHMGHKDGEVRGSFYYEFKELPGIFFACTATKF